MTGVVFPVCICRKAIFSLTRLRNAKINRKKHYTLKEEEEEEEEEETNLEEDSFSLKLVKGNG